MADELVFYTNPMSRGRIVRWMLEELGEPYRTEVLGFGPPMKSKAYLADAFPDAELAPPADDRRRAPYYRWMFFAAGPLEQAATNKAFGFTVPPDREGMAGYGTFPATIDALEGAVCKGDYILGEKFSAADVYVGSHIGWGMQFGTIEKRPAFERYWQRLSARPAARRAKEIDDALMPKEERIAAAN